MSDDLDAVVDNLKKTDNWLRLVFMAGFAVVLHFIVALIFLVIMVVQALFKLLSGSANANLGYFGASLSQYCYQVLLYLTYNSEEKPFPFSEFPAANPDQFKAQAAGSEAAEKKAPAKKATARKRAPSRKTAAKKSGSGSNGSGNGPGPKDKQH